MNWKQGGEPYLPYIAQMEVEYGLPTDLLARVAFQECSWRPEVIFGSVVSSAGAVGMFQLMPVDFPNAGQSWQTDAQTAGSYLAGLYRQFNDWTLAVAAYNWGPGHMQKYVTGQLSALPTETSNYVAKVSADVGITGQLA